MTDGPGQRTGEGLPVLLVLASTYPRWTGDPEPGFVHELCKRLTDRFRVVVVGPHAAGAKRTEMMDGVEVRRYRYAPDSLETLVNHGGIVSNLRRSFWKWLLLPGFVLGQAWAAWRVIATERPAVAHAHWLLPQGLVLALLGKLDKRVPPFVVTSHGADLFALRSSLMQSAKRSVARQAKALTVVSTAMREEMSNIGIDIGKVSVQPMGVDLTGRFTLDPTADRSRNEILFVGRLVEKKGLRYLIEAMPAIIAVHPSAFLTIAGFGPEENERKAQVVQLGLQEKVQFLGAVSQSDLPSLYRRAAVFVAPFIRAASGDREGLGLVSVEAAGCGCPVIVADDPAARHVFSDVEATWVVSENSSELAQAICRQLAGDYRQAFSEMIAASLRSRFDWSRVAEGYAVVLRNARNK